LVAPAAVARAATGAAARQAPRGAPACPPRHAAARAASPLAPRYEWGVAASRAGLRLVLVRRCGYARLRGEVEWIGTPTGALVGTFEFIGSRPPHASCQQMVPGLTGDPSRHRSEQRSSARATENQRSTDVCFQWMKLRLYPLLLEMMRYEHPRLPGELISPRPDSAHPATCVSARDRAAFADQVHHL
jgi:hypothetical protein